MAEPQIKQAAETQFIEQKITQRVTVNAGESTVVTVTIPSQAKAFLKGYGYTWYTSTTYQLSAGTLTFPSRTDQEGSTSIPVIYGNPFPITSGNIGLSIINGDSAAHTYDVVFYVLCNRIIPINSSGGELILATGGSGSAVGGVVIYDSAFATSAGVTALGLAVNPSAPSTLLAGTKTTTSAAATALAASTACKKVTIQVDDGSSDVLIGNATSQEVQLVATQSITIDIDNLSKIYIKRVTTDCTVNYIGS